MKISHENMTNKNVTQSDTVKRMCYFIFMTTNGYIQIRLYPIKLYIIITSNIYV